MTNQTPGTGPRPFGALIVYADESGTHNLSVIEREYPVFVLTFCVFEKSDYVETVVPAIQRFKLNWFGHDMVVLHEREMRKQLTPFKFLENRDRRDRFMAELNLIVAQAPMTIIAAVIDKRALNRRYAVPSNPYQLALTFCMERLWALLSARKATDKTVHCVFECRGKAEDRELELAFRRIADGQNFRGDRMPTLEIVFADKKANSSGLQLADLTARPIGLSVIRPDQQNRAFEVIEPKIRRDDAGRYRGFGMKVFP
ncbi:MAG: DUF3800 domain-containing protein [Rhizobiales bacterium]|nr:DUF3800 domain-containing protein [Hyphomicrobiales bacterium]